MAERRAPASILARTNLVLGISAVLIAMIAVAALNWFVIQPIAERSADDEAALLVLSAQTWVELPPDARPYYELELAANHDLIVSAEVRDLPEISSDLADGVLAGVTGDAAYVGLLRMQLAARLEQPVNVFVADDLYWVNITMGGVELQIGFSPNRRRIQPLYSGILIVVLGAGIVFVTSFLIVRRIARPLVLAAERAETFRGGAEFEPLPEQGPRELVSLARNFNTMARDISALIANRTTLLAGISHDLRTPLTRMRLALELLPENVDPALVARFERNLEAMDALISDALQFARGASEPAQPIRLRSLLEDIVSAYDTEIPVQVSADMDRECLLAVGAFRRVMANLVSNGIKHGADVRIEASDGAVHVIDSGPGIPVEARMEVFEPFYRLDKSRSIATGGSGLGLAIVKQLCQAHGWSVDIQDGPGGGTDVVVTLSGGTANSGSGATHAAPGNARNGH